MTMDVKDILEKQGVQLLGIDLDALEEELRTGEYDSSYARDCLEKISDIRAARKAAREMSSRPSSSTVLHHNASSSSGKNQSFSGHSTESLPKTQRSTFARGLLAVRDGGGSVKLLRDLLASYPYANEVFIDENIDLFTQDELKTLLKIKAFSEAFLEKYFTTLDHETLAKNQKFSEEFFITHFVDLDAETVLRKGINEWCDRAKRSTKLDVFLRIKGVRF